MTHRCACGQAIRVTERLYGRRGRCPRCGTILAFHAPRVQTVSTPAAIAPPTGIPVRFDPPSTDGPSRSGGRRCPPGTRNRTGGNGPGSRPHESGAVREFLAARRRAARRRQWIGTGVCALSLGLALLVLLMPEETPAAPEATGDGAVSGIPERGNPAFPLAVNGPASPAATATDEPQDPEEIGPPVEEPIPEEVPEESPTPEPVDPRRASLERNIIDFFNRVRSGRIHVPEEGNRFSGAVLQTTLLPEEGNIPEDRLDAAVTLLEARYGSLDFDRVEIADRVVFDDTSATFTLRFRKGEEPVRVERQTWIRRGSYWHFQPE